MIVSWALDASLVLVGIATIILVVRVALGPTLPDRVVAFDAIVVNVIVLVVLFGMRLKTTLFSDAAVALAILSFLTSVAAGKYLARGEIIDGDSD